MNTNINISTTGLMGITENKKFHLPVDNSQIEPQDIVDKAVLKKIQRDEEGLASYSKSLDNGKEDLDPEKNKVLTLKEGLSTYVEYDPMTDKPTKMTTGYAYTGTTGTKMTATSEVKFDEQGFAVDITEDRYSKIHDWSKEKAKTIETTEHISIKQADGFLDGEFMVAKNNLDYTGKP